MDPDPRIHASDYSDPDPDADPDPIFVFVIDLQEANKKQIFLLL